MRAAAAGVAIGFILSLLGLAYARILDDSVYVPSDFEKRYPYPVLGVTFAGEEESGDKLLQEHVELVSGGWRTFGMPIPESGPADTRRGQRKRAGADTADSLRQRQWQTVGKMGKGSRPLWTAGFWEQ